MAAIPTPSLDLLRLALKALDDKKGSTIVALDMQGRSTITDYVVLVCGANAPHLKALVTAVHLRLKPLGVTCYRVSGTPDSGWVVADYIDFVIHFLTPDARRYYALDDLWRDAPRLAPAER